MYEDDPFALLREMAQRNVMVEICLSSNRKNRAYKHLKNGMGQVPHQKEELARSRSC